MPTSIYRAFVALRLRLVQGRRVDDAVAAVDHGVLLRAQPDLLRDPLRRPVVRMNDRDQPLRAEHGPGEITRGGRALGGVALALQCGCHVVADLQFGYPVDDLRGKAAVPDEAAIRGGYQPEPEPVRLVQPAAPA